MNNFSKSVVSAFTSQDPPLDPGISTKTSKIQLFYGAWVNMAQLAIGLAFGFASIVIPLLSSPDSAIKITVVDASWIVSAVSLLVPLGCVISGFVMDWAGRRRTLIFCQVPMFVGWLYTALAKTAKDIVIARAITGLGCGMAMGPSRAYMTEIALPNMRGVIGAFPNLAVSLGLTFTAALGKYFSWQEVCYICGALTFLNCCSFFMLPETPYYILQTKTEAEARTNLALFRGSQYNIEKEMAQLIDFKRENNLRKLTLEGSFRMLFSKASCKPFTLMMIYNLIAQASGVSILLFWTIDLLQKTQSSFDVNTGNILMGATRVFMGIFTSLLLYRFGRKPLAMISAIGVTIVCCAFGLTLIDKEKPTLTPQICLMVYVVFASLGYYTLPLLMAFELYPLQVRGILGGATISISSLLMFATTKMETFLLDTLGVAKTFLSFGLFSLIGCVFIFFWLPETKDLTLQEIEEYYKDRRPTLSSQRRLESMHQLSELSRPNKKTKEDLERINRESTNLNNKLARLELQKKLSRLIESEKEQIELSTTSIKSADAKQKKTGGIKFGEIEHKNDDNETTKSVLPESTKSLLKVLYEEKIDRKEDDKDTPKDEKKDEETPKDEKKDEETPKDEDQPSTSKRNTE